MTDDLELLSPPGATEPVAVPIGLIETITWNCVKHSSRVIAQAPNLTVSQKLGIIASVAQAWLRLMVASSGAERSELEILRFSVAAAGRLKRAKSSEELQGWDLQYTEEDLKDFQHVVEVLQDIEMLHPETSLVIDEYSPGLFRYVPLGED